MRTGLRGGPRAIIIPIIWKSHPILIQSIFNMKSLRGGILWICPWRDYSRWSALMHDPFDPSQVWLARSKLPRRPRRKLDKKACKQRILQLLLHHYPRSHGSSWGLVMELTGEFILVRRLQGNLKGFTIECLSLACSYWSIIDHGDRFLCAMDWKALNFISLRGVAPCSWMTNCVSWGVHVTQRSYVTWHEETKCPASQECGRVSSPGWSSTPDQSPLRHLFIPASCKTAIRHDSSSTFAPADPKSQHPAYLLLPNNRLQQTPHQT